MNPSDLQLYEQVKQFDRRSESSINVAKYEIRKDAHSNPKTKSKLPQSIIVKTFTLTNKKNDDYESLQKKLLQYDTN